MLTDGQIKQFRQAGHLTIDGFFGEQQIRNAINDIDCWSEEFLQTLSADEQDWYLEQGTLTTTKLRKLDNPVFHREPFREMAAKTELVAIVEQLIGRGVSVFFSQVFMKPPEIGGPKPIHQDNFYFGPSDLNALLTVWIALDEATTENGCLFYSDQHQDQVLDHVAPEGEPFNLRIAPELADPFTMVAAPVRQGGVSLHHGNTPHQSSGNRSPHPRRAAALHYLQNDAKLVRPALPYDQSVCVQITS